MTLAVILSAIVVGLIIGALGRLVLPGRQDIPIWLTILIGIVAALIGSFIAYALGVGETRVIDWIELIIQVALAAAGVALVAGRYAPGSPGRRPKWLVCTARNEAPKVSRSLFGGFGDPRTRPPSGGSSSTAATPAIGWQGARCSLSRDARSLALRVLPSARDWRCKPAEGLLPVRCERHCPCGPGVRGGAGFDRCCGSL